MLILNEKDMAHTVTYAQIMDTVEDTYRLFQRGDFHMPERLVISHGSNALMYMPCFLPDCFGTKILTLFPENPAKGYPYIDGLMLLNDTDSGKTKAILDARYLTALRTGAAGGVGIRHFSRRDCNSVGIIGAGYQGYYQAVYASAARDIKDIYFFDVAPKNFGEYSERLKRAIGGEAPEIHLCGKVEELLEKSGIVITATTATSPVIPDDAELMRGKCFVAIGSYKPYMREIPDAIWGLVDHVYTELPFAMEESGDLSQPLEAGVLQKERVRYIGDWLARDHKPLPLPGQTTFFKSVGMSLLDIYVSRLILDNALEMGLGQNVDI